MSSRRQKIMDKAVEIISEHSEGIRFSILINELQISFPDSAKSVIGTTIYNLDETRKDDIEKPARGLFRCKPKTYSEKIENNYPLLASWQGEENIVDAEIKKEISENGLKEEDFYEPFANWLKGELDECTHVVPLGGKIFKSKWGTPDVIGTYKPDKKDVIQFNTEIISAEIKIDHSDPITAFGQCVAYRLFSSKVYLVEPIKIGSEDLDRIESLCMLFGIGLILFELDSENPNFQIRSRAQRFLPDMYYVNKIADILHNVKKEYFDVLF